MRTVDQQMVYLSDAAIPSKEANSIQTMKMCEAFAQEGLDVSLVVPDRSTVVSENPYEFYDVTDCFDIIRVPWKPGERYLYSLLVPYYVHQLEPDIIYGRFVPACFFTALAGYDVIVESHSPISESQRVIRWMFNMLLRTGRLKHLVVISEALKRHYLSTYESFKDSDVTVAHDAAVDTEDVSPFLFAESDRLQVGYVGHLYEGKGIKLIAELVRECEWADFHIVGGTREDIKRWEEKLDEQANITFHGFVPPSDVTRYQRSMDVLLAPYQRQVYGGNDNVNLSEWMSPLKLFEYMAASRVIVCSDLPVLREVVSDRKTAILCPPGDVSAWVDVLEEIADDSDLRNRIRKNARNRFQKHHTYTARAKQIISII